jgi:hypothetical protein
VIAATVIAFAASLAGAGTRCAEAVLPGIESSRVAGRPVVAERRLPESHRSAGEKVEAMLAEPEMKQSVKYFASYLGNGSPRFYLPLDQQLFNDNFAQFVVTTHDVDGARGSQATPRTTLCR